MVADFPVKPVEMVAHPVRCTRSSSRELMATAMAAVATRSEGGAVAVAMEVAAARAAAVAAKAGVAVAARAVATVAVAGTVEVVAEAREAVAVARAAAVAARAAVAAAAAVREATVDRGNAPAPREAAQTCKSEVLCTHLRAAEPNRGFVRSCRCSWQR